MAGEKPEKREMSRAEMNYLGSLYQNQYMLVTNTVNVVLEELQELGAAEKALERMDLVSEKESLQSIGGDFYIKAATKKNDTIIVGIGGSYLVEKDLVSARSMLETRLKKKNELINNLLKSKKELEAAIMDLDSKMNTSGT